MMAMTDRTGRTRLVCLKCEDVDPLKGMPQGGPTAVSQSPHVEAQMLDRTVTDPNVEITGIDALRTNANGE